jgi:EAL domain-containing protein (putative c-di-GMP-specific phosphodiesterase class I)
VCALGQSLEMQVLAEGVETAEQLTRLRSLGCELGQGYYFSKPLPHQATEELIFKHLGIATNG